MVRNNKSLTSFLFVLFLEVFLFFYYQSSIHWFFIIYVLLGTFLFKDVLKIILGDINFFEPLGIISIFNFHFFFLAPQLHIFWDYFYPYSPSLGREWPYWIGFLGFINLIGILIYRYISQFQLKPIRFKSVWLLQSKSSEIVLLVLLFVCLILQLYTYYSFGGIYGYILNYEDRLDGGGFAGYGLLFTISESFPKLFIIYIVLYFRNRKLDAKVYQVVLILFFYFLLTLFFGGLRGSRSNTIWSLFYAVFILHICLKHIPVKLYVFGFAFMMFFMYAYSFYKYYGSSFGDVVSDYENISSYEESSNKDLQYVLLSDLGRADIQSIILSRVVPESGFKYEISYGRTYLAAIGYFIPKFLWNERPVSKVKEGTDLQFGPGSYDSGLISRRIYGLIGEFLLNFGIYFFFVPFFIYGFVIHIIRRFYFSLNFLDSRIFIYPILLNFLFLFLGADMDNWLFFLFKNGFLIFVFLYLFSVKRRI